MTLSLFDIMRILKQVCDNYNPGQNILGQLWKLRAKMHFLNETLNPPLKKGRQCCFSQPFLLSPLPPSNVKSTENDLNAWHQHCIRGRGREEMRHFYGFIAFMSQEFWPGLQIGLPVRCSTQFRHVNEAFIKTAKGAMWKSWLPFCGC